MKRTFLKHYSRAYPLGRIFQTDDNGCVTLYTNGNHTETVTVTIFCQNPVVRVLDGNKFGLPLTQEVSFRDGEIVRITGSKSPHFRVLQQCLDAYDLGLREFHPYNQEGRRDFPFGRGGVLEENINMLSRIELSFPDHFPSPLSFVEPASVRTGFPLMRIKDNDRRLFDPDVCKRTLIPHELAHALHFAFLPFRLRAAVEVKYALWLAKRILKCQPPFHGIAVETSPFVAYIEAFPLFVERYVAHKITNPNLGGLPLHQSFFNAERNRATGNVMGLKGGDVEGAVMGAMFIDFADSPFTGLDFVVNSYIASYALSFEGYRNFMFTSEGVNSERSLWLNQVAASRRM
ncbi:MAG TPA: hypothetical protein VLB01_05055 [Thermodesulfobacteriota bacterium]|nr:hypothetical protein [Thermodesulfobacteriota bacterium]